MEVSVKQLNPEFVPFEVTIKFESLLELQEFYLRIHCSSVKELESGIYDITSNEVSVSDGGDKIFRKLVGMYDKYFRTK